MFTNCIAGPEGMSLIFTWLRLSTMRQLDWYRNRCALFACCLSFVCEMSVSGCVSAQCFGWIGTATGVHSLRAVCHLCVREISVFGCVSAQCFGWIGTATGVHSLRAVCHLCVHEISVPGCVSAQCFSWIGTATGVHSLCAPFIADRPYV